MGKIYLFFLEFLIWKELYLEVFFSQMNEISINGQLESIRSKKG